MELEFVVYINVEHFCKADKNIIAVVDPKFYVPKGNCDYNGINIVKDNRSYFTNIDDLCTYFADWGDIAVNHDLIKATVILNSELLHKVFVGDNLFAVLEMLNLSKDLSSLKNFPEFNF